MYKRILIPIAFDGDGDRDNAPAIEIARKLADADAEITFLHVLEEVPGYAINYMPADFNEAAREAIAEELERMAASVENGVARAVSGHSGRTILEWSEEHGADLIVIASHRPGLADYFLGSTAAHVVRHAGCSVHVIR